MSTRDEKIDIQIAGERIAGTLVTPGVLIPGVLLVHGWGGSQQQYLARAREIAALGCVCLTFDLRGHADTQGQNETVSRKDNLDDVLAAYDILAGQPNVDPNAIAVVGSSYGGYLAAILTGNRAVKWLALRVPALYMDGNWEAPKRQLHKDQDLVGYRNSLIPSADNIALRACSEFKGDVLIVESECDQTVPHSVITNYREACGGARSLTYRVIEGADHGLTQDWAQRAYTSVLVNWITEMVLGAREDITQKKTPTLLAQELPEAPLPPN
ncbi:MAG: permease [Burkholderiales bacterium RIFCSPLOWO2_02_FULL_57_36]|nr:MAG: permease [Burkholderiales bacterium RIFCSPLOWO2_02_FULL_57_36]